MSQGTSFAAVLGAFNGRVDDLKQLTMLRDAGASSRVPRWGCGATLVAWSDGVNSRALADPTATRASFQHLEAMVAAVELQLQHAQQKVRGWAAEALSKP
jgi:hypothetical protein